MYATITPLDTVFFRDGRAFTMGEETWGASRFPPPPSVVYGALRTRFFAEHPDRLSEAGTTGPTSSASLTAFHLRVDAVPHFPMPRDLVVREGAEGEESDKGTPVVRLDQQKFPSGGVGLGALPTVLTHREEVETVRQSVVDESDLENYLHGREATFRSYHLYDDGLVHREPKIGIRMDRSTRAASDGFLYRVDLRRLDADLAFGVGLKGLSIAERGLLKLGGESKPARYETVADRAPSPAPPRDRIAADRAFALYLATPALFDRGWLPGWIDPETLRGTKDGVTVQLQTAAVGKPGAVGGWNVKEGQPKPMHRTVPAGSVYHFALEDGTSEAAIEAFHDECLSDRRAEAGFGHTFIGVAPF